MINDSGTIPGVSFDDNGVNDAWIRYSDRTVVSFDVMDAGEVSGQGTLATAANVAGDTAGTYYDANGASHGFVRSRRGKSPSSTCRAKGLAPAKDWVQGSRA